MHSQQQSESSPCTPTCSTVATVRNRYFTGKYMTARDFEEEQAYFLSRAHMHNRLFHGWGVLCGLVISAHPKPDCRDRVIVSPGIALDCCGREVIQEEEQVVQVILPKHLPSPESQEGEESEKFEEAPEEEWDETTEHWRPPRPRLDPYLLVLRYCEWETEHTPVLFEEGCDPRRMEANRIREGACLEVIRWDAANREKYAACWAEPQTEYPCRNDCAGQPSRRPNGCLEPLCECELGIPLALIAPRWREGRFTIEQSDILIDGRREVGTPPEYMTHIVGYNWPHGGEVSLRTLRDEMNGQLRVTFDRRLMPRPEDNNGMGISRQSFTVQLDEYDDGLYPVEMLFTDGAPPYLDPDKPCEAVFTINDDLLTGSETIAGARLKITLYCDFILDCHGRPVDGDHLRGKIPTGNGTPGGTFVSWFRIEGHRRERRPYTRRR
jgi:hypothetical protein